MIRVLVADDQVLVRSGFRIILETEPDIEVVGEAANGLEAVALAAKLTPDVICMDVEMPELNGIEASRQILAGAASGETRSAPAILVLTTFGHEEYLFDALAAGVSGFLLKTARADQLIDAVRTLAAGGALLGPDVTRAVMERATRDAAPAPSPSPADCPLAVAGLTDREQDVLRLLTTGATNSEIAEQLYVGEATVKTHVSNLLQKLGARDRIQAIVWAHTQGVAASGPGAGQA